MAVSWVLSNPAITAPIVGASKPEQLTDTLAGAEYVIEDDLKRRLDEVTHEYRMGTHPARRGTTQPVASGEYAWPPLEKLAGTASPSSCTDEICVMREVRTALATLPLALGLLVAVPAPGGADGSPSR